ncbi:MAG: ADP-ribosylglycohydrolase family protein [Opitutales bacterium]|nr:ADP-ribosylglycohydrolase family protein [Opitutales bacterium]
MTSLLGDSLALGGHWLYNQDEIAAQIGPELRLSAPLSRYHPGKGPGDHTHYGDQTLILLESVVSQGTFDPEDFLQSWRAYWADPDTLSYRDGATRTTLANLAQGTAPSEAGSASSDIAGAARIGPLFLLEWENADALAKAARAQTALTHNHAAVMEAADFFARVTLKVADGMPVPTALATVADEGAWETLSPWWDAARASAADTGLGDTEAALHHGQSCAVDGAFPLICHLLLRYPDDAIAGWSANQMAGGDTAARALLMGLVYGARPDAPPLPADWLTTWTARPQVEAAARALAN